MLTAVTINNNAYLAQDAVPQQPEVLPYDTLKAHRWATQHCNHGKSDCVQRELRVVPSATSTALWCTPHTLHILHHSQTVGFSTAGDVCKQLLGCKLPPKDIHQVSSALLHLGLVKV